VDLCIVSLLTLFFAFDMNKKSTGIIRGAIPEAMKVPRTRKILIVSLIGAALCLASVVASLSLFPRLPFSGPYSGRVVDAVTAKPIAGASVVGVWFCHDNPLPDGSGHYSLESTTTTDAGGGFILNPPSRRGGWFGTSFSLQVLAGGYIEAVLIVDPNNTPLPPSTVAWPFKDTTVHTTLPAKMTVKLQPAKAILLKAEQSSDPLIKQTAQEMLQKLEVDS